MHGTTVKTRLKDILAALPTSYQMPWKWNQETTVAAFVIERGFETDLYVLHKEVPVMC